MAAMHSTPVVSEDEMRVMTNVTWDAFEAFLIERGEKLPRVAYLEGTLELMSPSRDHDRISRRFGAVVDAYLNTLGITWDSAGAWLLKHKPTNSGLEPDETYLFHETGRERERPDLAIEVIWTSGSINKLEIYRRLCVPEVWFWQRRGISIHVLTPNGFELRAASECLPDFDFALVTEMVERDIPMSDVHRELRARLPIV
jgi:Uma2 family endonuclease